MGSIDKRVNGTWRVRWREYPGGPQRCQHFDRKADASRFLAGVEGDLASGRYLDRAGGQVRFEVYAEQWRQAQIHRPTTAVQTESYLRNHAYPFLGARPLGEIRRSEIQAWVKGRSDVLAPGSVELAYRWVATIFKAAIADRLIAVSPCEKITLPRRDRPELVPMEVEMVERLADAVPERYRALIVMAAGTGLRQGECFGLTIDRVDFLRKQLRVDRQLISAQGRTPVFGPPKSKAGYRTVPLPGVVVDALAFHLQRHPGKPDTLVFTNYTGQPIRRSAFGDIWHRACRNSDIPKGFTFHDLRHFYASLLIAKGSSVKTVQRRLGHQSAIETLDTYSHLWPDNEDETRDAVDAVFDFGAASIPMANPSHLGQPWR